MGVVQNSIDIQKIIEAGGDPMIAAKVAELEAEIGDENSGIIKDIDDLQEANRELYDDIIIYNTHQTIKTGNDLNDYKTKGLYYIETTPTNAPDNVLYCALEVFPYIANNQIQVYQRITGHGPGGVPTIYLRRFKDNNTWSNWVKFTGTELA